MKIFVVDDDSELRTLLACIILDACGVEPLTFCDGHLACEYLEQSGDDVSPVLAFVDVEMPTTDGMTVVRTLKSHRARSVAVMMSGNREYREAVYKAGADYFLHKPPKLEELLGLIDRWSSREPEEARVWIEPVPTAEAGDFSFPQIELVDADSVGPTNKISQFADA